MFVGFHFFVKLPSRAISLAGKSQLNQIYLESFRQNENSFEYPFLGLNEAKSSMCVIYM